MLNIIYLTLSALLLNSCGDNQPDSPISEVGPVRQPPEPVDDFGNAIKKRQNIGVDEIAKYFVEEKNITKRDAGTGETPLMAAARYNNLPVVEYLLKKGAQPNDVWQNKDQLIKGYPSLWFAVNWNNAAMVKALLDAGADPRLGPTSGLGPIIHLFAESGTNNEALEQLLKTDKTLANWKVWTGTPLHRAANSQRIETIKLLLRYGADKTLTDHDGKTPWQWANTDTRKAVPELQP